MVDKILEIITYLAENIVKGKSVEKIKDKLLLQGYSEDEINLALSFFLFASKSKDNRPIHKMEDFSTARILHTIESLLISPEAYGHLLKLRALKIIDDEQMERIIEESLLHAEDQIGVDEMKKIAMKVIFHFKDEDYNLFTDEDKTDKIVH